MPILKDTTIKGDLIVLQDIVEDGVKLEDKYASSIVIEGYKIKLVSPSGVVISETTLPTT